MTDSDPFSAFESERTVIKPSAGRARPAAAAAPATASFHSETMRLPEVPGSAGQGPLLLAASSLLVAGARIRAMAQHPDPAGLRNALVEAVRKFEADARARGLPNEQVVAGRYLLCTYVDECASSTPWGGSGAWSAQSLLVLFHNESWGGEKLFQLLGKLAENVPANQGLLELIYCILALGFEGRYRVLPNGRAQLDAVREKLALMLRGQSGSAAVELSPHWAGVAAPVSRLRDGVPVWVVGAAAALVLVLVFLGLRWTMSARSSETFAALQALDVKPAAMPAPMPAVPAEVPRLSAFLKPDIDAGNVEVRDLADRSIITVPGDGLFEPGSAKLSDKVLPLMGRIADALQRTPGQILISGNTDNQPIRSVRFPSNWELSKERAESVQELLATKVKPPRMRAEGLADTRPLVDNGTPVGRAKNRRIEITLRLAAAAG